MRKRFFGPLALQDIYYQSESYPAEILERMPAGYFFAKAEKPLAARMGQDTRRWTVSWMQGAGGIVTTTETLTHWVRALYGGKVLAPAQQAELESVVSMKTGKPIATTSAADPRGFGLGVVQATGPGFGKIWFYEGGTPGYRVLYTYIPKSDAVITIGLNSSADSDDIAVLFKTLYATLEKAGRA